MPSFCRLSIFTQQPNKPVAFLRAVEKALSAKPQLRYPSISRFASAFASAALPSRIPRIAILAAAAAAAIVAAVVGWKAFYKQGGQTWSNESFDRYDPARDEFATSQNEGIRKQIEAREKKLHRMIQDLRAKVK